MQQVQAAMAALTRWGCAHARHLRPGAAVAGLIVLALMIGQAGPARIGAGLSAIGPWFLVVLAISCTWILCNTWAWRLALRPARARFLAMARAHLAAESVSNLTPFMALGGEPVKVLSLGRIAGNEAAVASVVADNVVHAASAPLFMLIGLALGGSAFALEATLVSALLAGIVVVGIAASVLLRASGRGLVAPITRLAAQVASRYFPDGGEGADSLLHGSAPRIDKHVREFLDVRGWRFWASLAAHLAGRLMGGVEAWIIMNALGVPFSLAAAIFVVAIAHVLVNLVFSIVPSQLGVQEATAYLLFSAAGLDPAAAVTLMLARRVRGFFWNAIGLALLAHDPARSRRDVGPQLTAATPNWSLGLRGKAVAASARSRADGSGPRLLGPAREARRRDRPQAEQDGFRTGG